MNRFCAVMLAVWTIATPLVAPAQTAGRIDAKSAIERASKLTQGGDPATAIRLLDPVIAADPTNAEALVRRSWARMVNSDYEDALADSTRAMQLPSFDRGRFVDRAQILRLLGRDDEALAAIREMTNGPDSAKHLHGAMLAFAQYGRYDEANAVLERMVRSGVDIGWAHISRAGWLKPDAVAQRLEDYARGVEARPDGTSGYEGWGDLLRQTGDHRKAVEIYTRGLRHDSKDVTMLAGREASYRALGDIARADKDAAALAKSDKLWFAQFMQCRAKGEANVDLESALAACDAALADQPDSPGILHDRGIALYRLGRFAEAKTMFDQILRTAHWMSRPRYGRALARKALGDLPGAQEDAAFALRVDPQTGDEFKIRGLAL